MEPPFDPLNAAAGLLARIGQPVPASVSPLPGGRNNWVWVVESGAHRFLLKRYCWSEQDPRDRMGQEWAFLHYLRQIGCRRAPNPLASDPSIRCALMEFVEGRAIEIHEVTESDVEAAADFLVEINRGKSHAASILPVSDACFTLGDHLATVSSRVERIGTIESGDACFTSARNLVRNRLVPLWKIIEARIRTHDPLSLNDVLPEAERCLSPSDFGFHNALRQSDGTLRFLDFEYAGWDDPAKTIIDFCNQPDGLLSDSDAALFLKKAMEFPASSLASRIALLEPLYQLKWACICLSGFLPGRGFSDPRPSRSPEAQLARAHTMADRASKSLGAPLAIQPLDGLSEN